MLSQDSKSQQSSLSRDTKADAGTPVLDPQDIIEGAPGDGPPDDPGASDHKPPGIADLEYLA